MVNCFIISLTYFNDLIFDIRGLGFTLIREETTNQIKQTSQFFSYRVYILNLYLLFLNCLCVILKIKGFTYKTDFIIQHTDQCMYICMYVCIYVCMYLQVSYMGWVYSNNRYKSVYARPYSMSNVYVYVSIYISYTHTYTSIHIYTHLYTYTHTHTPHALTL